MTLSYSITHVSGNTTESVTTAVAEKTSMALNSNVVDSKTGRVTATYVLGSGDQNHPAYVTFIADPPNQGAKGRYVSATLKTWLTQTDSITGLITWWPIQGTMSFVIPDGAPVQLTDLNQLCAVVFSYTYLSVTSGVRDTTWISNLMFGNPQVK